MVPLCPLSKHQKSDNTWDHIQKQWRFQKNTGVESLPGKRTGLGFCLLLLLYLVVIIFSNYFITWLKKPKKTTKAAISSLRGMWRNLKFLKSALFSLVTRTLHQCVQEVSADHILLQRLLRVWEQALAKWTREHNRNKEANPTCQYFSSSVQFINSICK